MRLRYKPILILALLFCSLVIPGCMHTEAPPPPCPPDICHVVIPQCQPPAPIGMPHEAVLHLGFRPYVATWLPNTVYSYGAQPYSSEPSLVHPLPLMHIGYMYDFPRPYNGWAPHAVIAFDETSRALGLTTNIYVPGQTLTVTSKTPVEINGQTATLFELQGQESTGTSANDATHVIGVQWQTGSVWLRVTALTSGRYFLLPNGDGEDVAAWDGMSTDVLLRVARSAQVYTGCDKQASGAHVTS